MFCVHSNAEQNSKVITSSPVAVNQFSDERVSIRRLGKVSQVIFRSKVKRLQI